MRTLARGLGRGQVLGLGRSALARHGRSYGRGPTSRSQRNYGNGPPRKSPPIVCCLGSRLPTVSASSSTSLPSVSRRGGRRRHWPRSRRRRGIVAPASGRFRRRSVFAVAAGFAAARSNRLIAIRCCAFPLRRHRLRLRRAARRKPAHRPLRAARRAHGRQPHRRQAAARAAFGQARLAPPAGSFVESRRCLIRRCSRCAGLLRFRPRSLFPANRRLGLCPRRGQCDHAAGHGRPDVARQRRGAAAARRHRRSCARRAAGRHRRDFGDATQRQARRDLGKSLQRLVHFRRRPRAVDLRLSHGGRRRRGVFHHSRLAGADPGPRRPKADQKVGGARRADRDDVLSGALGRGSGDATLLFHDRHRAHRRHARSPGADHPHA